VNIKGNPAIFVDMLAMHAEFRIIFYTPVKSKIFTLPPSFI